MADWPAWIHLANAKSRQRPNAAYALATASNLPNPISSVYNFHMEKSALVVITALALLLTGCLPVATLQTAVPVSDSQVIVGLTAVANADSNNFNAGAMPYLAYVWGDGKTEFSISTQIGLRGGVKQLLAENVSLAGGLTIPWLLFTTDWQSSLPFTIDTALLYDVNPNLTLALRGMYGYLSADLGNAWLGGVNLTYGYDAWLFEGGVLISQSGSPLISLSGAYRF